MSKIVNVIEICIITIILCFLILPPLLLTNVFQACPQPSSTFFRHFWSCVWAAVTDPLPLHTWPALCLYLDCQKAATDMSKDWSLIFSPKLTYVCWWPNNLREAMKGNVCVLTWWHNNKTLFPFGTFVQTCFLTFGKYTLKHTRLTHTCTHWHFSEHHSTEYAAV